ncbi:uncharacterized protein BDV17DRAFT_286962 [Aspergillus undulatus]|uniref:uncharacterized protein n=1 Tax=Aspergillus undulatus TaxID=1810928 RepID=UPI003CCD47F6
MVLQNSGSAVASSSREYSISFALQPPTSVGPGVAFTLPVIVTVRPVGAANSDLQQLGASASLRDETGASSTVRLAGTTSSSVRSRAGNGPSGYARFDRLTIASPGKYKLRITLVANTFGGVKVKEFVESAVIQVHSGAAASQRPTPTQIAKLQSLIPENIDISQADITAWQRA